MVARGLNCNSSLMARFLFLALFLIAGCAGHSQERSAGTLLPMPTKKSVIDPDNAVFLSAIAEYLKTKNAPVNSRYEYTRIDLDHDGRREGLLLMKSPHRHWCDMNGCLLSIFEAMDDGFILRSEISPVRGPLVISKARTNDWSDIIVRVSGRADQKTRSVRLRYDEFGARTAYHQSPDQLPATDKSAMMSGTRIFP